MTASLAIPGASAHANDALATSRDAAAERRSDAARAARQFEGLMLGELLKVLRQTAPDGGMLGGGDFGASMHVQMFDQQIADTLAERGVGISDQLMRQFGGRSTEGTIHRPAFDASALALARIVGSGPAVTGTGAVDSLRRAAAQMLAEPDAALRWSRDGALGPGDLASPIETPTEGGVARFNVQDARGYQGYYKCNLFALELSRRAGFEVPVVGRERGWGYPGPNGIADDAADGHVRGDWARVVTGASAEALQAATESGQSAFLLSGSGAAGHRGHMAVVERVHEVHYDDEGRLSRIVFDSWETRPNTGAQHMVRRTWNVEGNPGGHLAREHFGRIEILELRRPGPGQAREVPLYGHAGTSLRDVDSDSSTQDVHPNVMPRNTP